MFYNHRPTWFTVQVAPTQPFQSQPQQSEPFAQLGSIDIERLRLNEPDTWQLLTLAYGGGPILPSDVDAARQLTGDFVSARAQFTAEEFTQMFKTAQTWALEKGPSVETRFQCQQPDHSVTFNPPISPDTPAADHQEKTIDSKLPVMDELLQERIHDLYKIVKKLFEEKQKWKRILLNSSKQPRFPTVQNPLPGTEFNRPLAQYLSTSFFSIRPRFDWITVWSILIAASLIGFFVWLLIATGGARVPQAANATGFHIDLPSGHTWTALGSSEWISPQVGNEPQKIVVYRLGTQEAEAMKKLMARAKHTAVTLPAGSADRTVMPRRGTLLLPTGQVAISYQISASNGPWIIMCFCLSEAEADALAGSFSVTAKDSLPPPPR